ncbi:stage II sporulation protein M [Agaribacterium haliotis]|uniref:stage II sporulation protein M n=1 Tax=Agaribacterium haliotis TaxID=2013869 RepID=UPI000BB54B9B|nr:stage II sporulation protein M [Agaribacterium haliotis]
MKQQDFELRHERSWQALEQDLLQKDNSDELIQLPERYHSLCQQLALAKQRRYSAALIQRLNSLVIQSHNKLYRDLPRARANFLYYLVAGFPQAVRRNRAYVGAACALFFAPGLLFFILCWFDDSLIYSLMSYEQVKDFEAMYEPGNQAFGRERQSDTDFAMFGFYIKNNIGISFQCFAGGILFCIGSIFFLLYNGLFIGAAAGHIAHIGYNETFFPFVVGHGSFELIAIALAGAAGLKLGWALLSPGQLGRISALRLASKDAITIIYGSTVMLLIAAFIEAFWSSSSSLANEVKYSVGGLLWFLVIYYLATAGRHLAPR